MKQRCFAQRRASIPIKAAFSRWGYCAPPLAACISYASRSLQKHSCATAADFCRGLTTRELRQNNLQLTAGQRLYQQLGLTGARGEAEAGYPLVIRHALPHYRALLAQGRDPELALLDTLLLLMSLNGDTNVASRGGADGLRWLQQQAAVLLHQGGIRTPDDLVYLHRFDQQCIERNLSPGGSADLLIVTWFLAQISQVNH